MKILAVDDEELGLNWLTKQIQKAVPSAEVDAFSSTADVIEAAKNDKYEVAFTDIHMPGMSGIDLAKALKRINPLINIIFVTGFGEYKGDAISLLASGYIEKPATEEDIAREMDNLLHPVEIPQKVIFVRAFGNFEIFVDGKPVDFAHAKSKELLACLVDQRGAEISKRQLGMLVFEDGVYSLTRQNYLSKLLHELQNDLKNVGAEHIMHRGFGTYSIDPKCLSCDAYLYLDGSPEAVNRFRGEYMEQYRWAKKSKARFLA